MRTSVAFTLISLVAAGCSPSQGGTPPQSPPAAIVTVSVPLEESVVTFVDYTGRTDAAESVEIRSRVTGFLNAVRFEEGAEVEKDAPLFDIDDREYQADLEAAQAELASARAHQQKATTDFQRVDALKQRGAASAEEYDRADAARKEADASVESSLAKQTRAQLNVDFSKIASPISGKISRSQITPGNLISADVTVLTTIVTVEPMHVYFDVDERTILTIKKQVREGELEGKKQNEIPVLMGLTIDHDYPHVGTIDFIDNRVDPRTGTIRVRGKFANPRPDRGERILEPGLFARVRVPIGEPKRALLVAERAIGTDQGQKFLYVLNNKDEVLFRPVQPGLKHGDGLRVIAAGLRAGERVVVDGLQRVRPGAVVQPKIVEMRSRPGGSARGSSSEDTGSPPAGDADVTPSQVGPTE